MKIILDKQFWQKYFLTGQGINANITALYIMLLYLFGGAYLPKTDRGTLNKIHEAAKKEFLEKGFKDASLRNIVKTVGVTTGAFNGYYKSKEELFEALVGHPAWGLNNPIYF